MPRSLAPHKSGAHRRACLSLYRALLSQCAQVGTATENPRVTETLQSIVRYRFRKDQKTLSPSQASNGLQAGHDFLSLLQGCSQKSWKALDQLSQALESVTLQADGTAMLRARLASYWKPPDPSRVKHLENLRRVKSKANHFSTPENPRIFQNPRPLSEVKSGARKVPNFILTHGIPLLKYPGPTPVLMNRVLKHKILWGTKKYQQHTDLRDDLELAEREDEWDVILERDHGIRDCHDDGPPLQHQHNFPKSQRETGLWAETIRHVDKQLERAVLARGQEYAEMGRKLWQVVLAERKAKADDEKAAGDRPKPDRTADHTETRLS